MVPHRIVLLPLSVEELGEFPQYSADESPERRNRRTIGEEWP